MAFRPFGNDIGQRAFDTICAECWSQWLQHQQALINHYALNVQDPKAKEFLFASMERYLFEGDDGLPTA
jgi:Fe-S cluster biosynthesis and repair protein YggX